MKKDRDKKGKALPGNSISTGENQHTKAKKIKKEYEDAMKKLKNFVGEKGVHKYLLELEKLKGTQYCDRFIKLVDTVEETEVKELPFNKIQVEITMPEQQKTIDITHQEEEDKDE